MTAARLLKPKAYDSPKATLARGIRHGRTKTAAHAATMAHNQRAAIRTCEPFDPRFRTSRHSAGIITLLCDNDWRLARGRVIQRNFPKRRPADYGPSETFLIRGSVWYCRTAG